MEERLVLFFTLGTYCGTCCSGPNTAAYEKCQQVTKSGQKRPMHQHRSHTDALQQHGMLPYVFVVILCTVKNEYPAPLPARRRLAGGCGDWAPEMVQCYNMGQDGFDAAWKCETSMPDGYSFSSVEVCVIVRSSIQITRVRRLPGFGLWVRQTRE